MCTTTSPSHVPKLECTPPSVCLRLSYSGMIMMDLQTAASGNTSDIRAGTRHCTCHQTVTLVCGKSASLTQITEWCSCTPCTSYGMSPKHEQSPHPPHNTCCSLHPDERNFSIPVDFLGGGGDRTRSTLEGYCFGNTLPQPPSIYHSWKITK